MDFSLYFHIPFCTRKCHYCHFYILPDKESLKKIYMESLKKEWAFHQSKLATKKKLISIYFGGGTPFLLGPERIAEILSWIKPEIGVEITLEANPENISKNLMQQYAAIGINRLSAGIQCLDDSLLSYLGRTHDSKKAIESIHLVKECGINNISIDLMYDQPGQTLQSWQDTLEKALKLPISHLSLYNLTIEPHTVFFKRKEKQPNDELSLAFLDQALCAFKEAGLERYEISAFCKNGAISKHNTGYWTGRNFLGFGPSAFSYWEGKRFKNISNISKYAKLLENNESPIDFEETLPKDARQKELFAIGIRMFKGINLSDFQKKHGLNASLLSGMEKLIEQGLLLNEEGWIRLSAKGTLFYDTIAEELI